MSSVGPVSVAAAAAMVRSGDVIVAPLFPGLTKSLLRAICERLAVEPRDSLDNLTLMCGDHLGRHDYLDVIPRGAAKGRLRFVGLAGSLPRRDDIDVDWLAHPLIELSRSFRTGARHVDVCLLPLTPPGKDGLHRISPSLTWLADAATHARTLLAEVSPNLPSLSGDNAILPSRLSSWVESDACAEPLVRAAPDAVQSAMARHVATLIPDGACLQVGMGAFVEALMQELRNHRHLGFHGGSLPDGAVSLIQSGVIDNSRKPAARGIVATHSVRGTEMLYRFVDRNPLIQLRGASFIHAPRVIASIPDFIAINSALMVDLNGQASAEVLGGRVRGPGGGMLDFMRAAALSEGGRRIVAMASTDIKTGRSRLVSRLPPGDIVSAHRADVDFVVTEFGIADLRGTTMTERRQRLALVAHPQFREALLAGHDV